MAKSRLNSEDDNDGWIGQRPRMDEEDLRRWAADRNGSALSKRADWWYQVRADAEGRMFVEKLEGPRAIEARLRAAGRRIEYYRPTPEDLASINGFIARCRENGLSPEEFNELVRRTGGAPRR